MTTEEIEALLTKMDEIASLDDIRHEFGCDCLWCHHRNVATALRFLLKEREWQGIETVPQNRVVLVSLISPAGKRATVKAKFIPAKTEEASFENDHAEYDEASDAYFCPEGWYEDVYAETGLDYGYVQFDGKPTHWRPLPSPPKSQEVNNER